MAIVFNAGHFEQLHRILTDAKANPARVAQSNEWYIAIDRSRAELVDIARAKGPNENEKREIQSGKVTIEGVQHSLNEDFAQQSIQLSQYLQVSERYAASLLQSGMQARAKWGRSAIEVACILFHRERLAAIACLRELIGGAAELSREEDSQAQKLGAKMQQLVDAMLAGGTIVQRILAEIDGIKSSMEKVQQSLRGNTQGLGDEVQLQLVQMLRKERQDLGHVLYLLSITRALGAQGILTIAGWLSKFKSTDQNDAMIIYLLIVLLNSLEVSSEEEDYNPLLDDRSFIKQMHAELTTKTWNFGEPQNVALLQWTLFLAEATKRSPSLASDIRVHQDTLQKLFTDAVQGNAFYSIALRILAFRQRQIDALEGEEEGPAQQNNANNANTEEEEIDPDFQENILEQIQNLILSLTSVMLPFLRKMQRSEEDAAFAASRSGNVDSANRRYDIEALFDSVSLLCRARPDAGLPFWQGPEGRGTRFLNWAIEVREPGHQRSLFEMLASLSGGKESAWHAHSLLSSGDTTSSGLAMQQPRFVSWNRLFEWVQQFINSYRVTNSTTAKMTSNEAIILRGFFRLLRNVAIYSVPAREALYQHSTYEIVPRLFALYTCPIMIDLKSTILDALAAFAHSSGPNAAKITAQLWSMLESSVGVSKTTLTAALHDLQAVEVPARTYPTTTSLVNLLKSLIHTPKRIDQQSIETLTGNSDSSTFSGLALNLGHGQRSPGLEPYIDFVIESVLLQAGSREYSDQSERWRVVAACLDFVERCLMSFDLNVDIDADINSLALHPGFSIMKRILTGTRLLQEILNIINPNAGVMGAPCGFEIINTNKANTLFFAKCVRHCLRIIQRVLQIQDVFLQVLLPTLEESVIDNSSRFGHLSSYTPLDSLLLHAHQSVVQMALYINCTRSDVALLAIRIIGLLAASSAFSGVDRFGGMGYNRKMNRLVGLLEMSDEADRIRAGCVDRLEAEADEPVVDVDANVRASLALLQISGLDDEEDELQKLVPPTLDADEAIRLAILDLLITNTTNGSDAPNVAHLLLGFDLRVVRPEDQIIPDADAFDTPPSALHAILSLLRSDRTNTTMSIAERSPAFTEKCHQLIGNLCRHPFTSTATLRYLRTKEDFFVRQLRSLPLVPVKRTSAEFGAMGKLIQPDGGHITTTVDALVSSLHIRSHVLSMIALELHTLCNAQMWAAANRLVAVLLGRDSVLDIGEEEEEEEDEGETSIHMDRQAFEQGGMRLLEILNSLDFEWHDEREQNNEEPTILRNLDLSQASSNQVNREFDIRATIRLLAAAHRELDRRGDLSESRRRADFHKDAALILEHVAARNARRVIALARRTAMQAWRNTLDMTFTQANHLLDVNGRANVILDCLSTLLPRLYGATSESDPALSDLAAGAVLGLLTKLRQHQTSIMASEEYAQLADLPIDRLIATLQALVGAIIEPGTTMQARGNLYSALINFLQLVKVVPVEEMDEYVDDDGTSTLDGESEFDDTLSFATGGVRKRRISAIEIRTRSLLAAQAERLIPVIARDALDASDVWRTVAFTLFDRLAALQGGSSSRTISIILDILGRKGFLKSFVANIREMDIGLQEVLKPDPSTLNALYVYEAQMAFFNRLAQSKRGAERLVDARIFEILTQVDFLQARPQQHYPYSFSAIGADENEFAEFDTFLPAVANRYEALLMPSIQLCVSILFSSSRSPSNKKGGILATFSGTATPSTSSGGAPRQALSFLQAHRNTLLISLKNATQYLISLTALEQAQLVISMLVFVLPMLDDDALSPPKPMAQFHYAVLAISATFLYEPHWKPRLVPFTEAEREMQNFDVQARSTVERLLGSLLAYLERVSEYAGVDQFGTRKVRPCLTNSLYTHSASADLSTTTIGPGRYGFEAGGRNPNVASLGTALAGLDENIQKCNVALIGLDKIQNMLDNVDNVQFDEWDEVIGVEHEGENLTPSQRKMIAIRILRSQRSKIKIDIRFYLNCIEMLLVLLYRHFTYYIELGTANAVNQKAMELGFRKSVNPVQSATETSALVHDGERITSKVLESLQGVIDLIEDEQRYGIVNANERKAYIEMTARRLQGVFLNFVEEVNV